MYIPHQLHDKKYIKVSNQYMDEKTFQYVTQLREEARQAYQDKLSLELNTQAILTLFKEL